MRWPLRNQILVPFSLLIMAAVLGLTALSAYFAAARVERAIEAQLRSVAKTLLDSNFPLTDTVLRQMHGLSGADYVVVGATGQVVAASKPVETIAGFDQKGDSEWSRLELRGPANFNGSQAFFMALQMQSRLGNQQPATLYILYPVDTYRSAQWAAVYPSLIFGAIILTVAIVLSYWIARRISRPLADLCQHVERLASAEFVQMPVPVRNDELRDLIRSMNILASELTVMRDTIQKRERLALLGQLSAGMIHSLRNEITGAKIAVQLHQRDCRDDDPESLQVALRQLQLSEENLKRLLSAGPSPPIERTATDVVALVEDVAALLRPTCRHRQVTLRVNATPEPCWLPLDGGQLRQAIIALLFNAIDAAGAKGEIELVVEPQPDQVCIDVRDSGPGASVQAEERLFDPFFTTKPEGVGLGLTSARQIALAHGGSLEYRRQNDWTSFQLLLPRDRIDGVETPAIENTCELAAVMHEVAPRVPE